MTYPTEEEQIKLCLKLQIDFFTSIHGQHNLCCPECGVLAQELIEHQGLIKYLSCKNINCRTREFCT